MVVCAAAGSGEVAGAGSGEVVMRLKDKLILLCFVVASATVSITAMWWVWTFIFWSMR